MAKNRDNSEHEEFSIRFIDVRVKGSSSTIQSAIRSISDAVGGRPTITRIAPPATPPEAALPAGDGVIHEQPELAFDDIEEGEIEESKPVESKPKRPRTTYYPKPFDVDLNAGKMSFEKFCQQKGPSTDNERYLVVAHWFKEYQGTELIKVNHVLTCFLAMKWDVPKDLRSCFRRLEKAGQMKAHKDGLWEITYNGVSDVNKMGG